MNTNSEVGFHSGYNMNNEPVAFQKLRINSYPRPEKYHGLRNGLRAIEEIPIIYRHIFSDYEQFNKIQSKVFDDVLYTNKNVIVSAPTGSGKTIVFELAIIQLLMELEDKSSTEDFKIVYIAPIKALCTERYTDWCKKFNPIGLSCIEVTGDSDISDFSKVDAAQLIVTTPEKWDSITRRWKDNENIVVSVKLFMIDEVHLLNEDVRGPILEAIVSRMKTIHFSLTCKEMGLRFIAVSATIPNIEDMAVWFSGKEMASYHRIAEELRPVELVKHVLGYNTPSTGFKFDMGLNYKLGSVVRKYSNKKPTLIFCSSRKAVEMASTVLYNEFSLIPLSDHQKSSLLQISKCIQDHKLKNMVTRSVAFHHAGLSYNDRSVIEDAFRKSLILVLVCTSTLAMGVNLPAHLVIIKSTETFVCGSVLEYSESSVLQMIGRAGRPQFDVQGVAVIMTQERKVKKYQNLINGCTPVESHLHKHLAEHLNSEIVLQTITNLEVAMKWIRSTFLYVRAVKSPMSYGLANGMTRDNVEKKLEDMCLVQINALKTHGLISSDKVLGIYISSTVYGRLMARYYISFETMKLFKKVRGDETFLQILNTIVSCKEFSELKLRVSDKKSLNELNNTPIRYPIKGRIKTTENKISCLIQSILGNLVVKESSLTQDAFKIIRIGERISKCLMDYIRSSEKELNGKVFKALLNSTIISKCIRAKLWENSIYVCKQLNKIGPVYSTLLVNSGKTSFEAILETPPRNLEMILNKAPPFGNEIHDVISSFPNYDIQLELKGRDQAQITIKQINEKHISDGTSSIIIIGDSDNNLLLYHDKVDFIIAQCGCFDRTVQIKNVKTNTIHAHLIHEKLVGLDKTISIVLNPNTEDDFERKNKQPKRKIQSKLKLKKNPRKTKSSRENNDEVVKDSDQYITLFEDNDLFENIEENLLNNSQNKNENCTIENQDKEIAKPIGFKRKLTNFEYMPRPKIPKNDDKEKDIPINLNDISVNLDDTSDTGYDEHNSQSQENTDMKVDEAQTLIENGILQATQHSEEINRLEHVQDMSKIRPNTPTDYSAESNSCKKQKIANTETCYSEKPFDITKYLYESCDITNKSQQHYENSQQNKNDDEKLILTQRQNFLKKYTGNFSDIKTKASYGNVVPPNLNVYSKKSNGLPTQMKDFKKASEIQSDYMTSGAYSSPYKYRENIPERKPVNEPRPYIDFRNSQKFDQKQNRLFYDNCSLIMSPHTGQILDENVINSGVLDLSKKTRENDQSNTNLMKHSETVCSKFRLGLNNPIDFSKKLHNTHQINKENGNSQLNYRNGERLENCPEVQQFENETIINLDSEEDRLYSFLNRSCTDRQQNLGDPKVLSPYFQNNTFFKNPDYNNITENENNFFNFQKSQNSSDHLKSTSEKILPDHKNINNLDLENELSDIFKTPLPSQKFNQSKELSFSSNNSIWMNPSQFDISFKGKDDNKYSFSDDDDVYFKSISQAFETKTDTEQESSSKTNISTETIDLTRDDVYDNNIHMPPSLRKIRRKESQERRKEVIIQNDDNKEENNCFLRPYAVSSDMDGETDDGTYVGELKRTRQIDDNSEIDEKRKHYEYRKNVSTKSSQNQNMNGIYSRIQTFYETASNCQNILGTGTHRLNKIVLSLCDSNPGLVINKFNILQKNFNISNMKPLPEENDNEKESINEYITDSSAILAGKYINKQNFDKIAKVPHYSKIVRLPDIDKIKNMKLLTETANKDRHKPNQTIIKKSPTFRFGYIYNKNPKETTSRNCRWPNNNQKENNNELTKNRIDRKRDEMFDKIIANYEKKIKYNRIGENNSNRCHKKQVPRRPSESNQFTEIQNEKNINPEDLERKEALDYIKFKYDNKLYDNEEEYFKDFVRYKFADVSNFREREKRNYSLSNIDIYSKNHNFQSTDSLNKNDIFLSCLPHAQEVRKKYYNLSSNNEYLKKPDRISQQISKNDDFPLNFSFDSEHKSQTDFIADIDEFLNNNISLNSSSRIVDQQSVSSQNNFNNNSNNFEDFGFSRNEFQNKFPTLF